MCTGEEWSNKLLFSHLESEKSDNARDLNNQIEHPFSKDCLLHKKLQIQDTLEYFSQLRTL